MNYTYITSTREHVVTLNEVYDKWWKEPEIFNWLKENNIQKYYWHPDGQFYFKKKDDAMKFKLVFG